MVASLGIDTDMNGRDQAIALLDAARRQYDSARIDRLRYMKYGRESGLSCHDIGIVLGITGEAVRKALIRAGDLD